MRPLSAFILSGLLLAALYAVPPAQAGRDAGRATLRAKLPAQPSPSRVEGLLPDRSPFASFDSDYLTRNDLRQSQLASPQRVLAIRVHFQPDTLSTTWGEGSFSYTIPDSIPDEEWVIDRPPHDRQYFQDHLLAARNYFAKFSNYQLILSGVLQPDEGGDVFPLDPQASYELPYPIWHVNYGDPDDHERLNETLTQLFIDAWTIADANGLADEMAAEGVSIDDYDQFIIFHAGAGNEFDTGFDLTPHDIPSVTITSADLRDHAGVLNGVELSSGTIYKGIILPETQRQPGIDVGLHGTVVAQIGYTLGLPHLYDTEDGDAGIGMFGLMDRGFGAYFGQIPIPPSAWSRVFMGWQEPVTVSASQAAGDTLLVPAMHLPDTFPDDPEQRLAKLFRIPINETEYYLIENRRRDPDDDSLTYAFDRDGRKITFFDDYSWEAEDGFRVAVTYDDYDFDLPASGLLLWHIDDRVIAANYADDTIQNDFDLRGIRLEEADGTWDIGKDYAFLQAGDGTEYGYSEDAFFRNNEYWPEANRPRFRVEFSASTVPASTANNGGNSHIVMSDFSVVQDTMSFTLSNGWMLPGLPSGVITHGEEIVDLIAVNLTTNNDIPGDVEDSGVTKEILALTREGNVFAWSYEGELLGMQELGAQPLYEHPGGFPFATHMAAAPSAVANGDEAMPWDVYLAGRGALVRISWPEGADDPEVFEQVFDEVRTTEVADMVALNPAMTAGTELEDWSMTVLYNGLEPNRHAALLAFNRDQGLLEENELPQGGENGRPVQTGGFILTNAAGAQTAASDGLEFHVLLATGTLGSFAGSLMSSADGTQIHVLGELFTDAILVPYPQPGASSPQYAIYAVSGSENGSGPWASRLHTIGLGWSLPSEPGMNSPAVMYSRVAHPVDWAIDNLRALDPDGDGRPEPAFIHDNQILALEPNGILTEGTPIDLSKIAGDPEDVPSWLMDSDGDGDLEWVLLSSGPEETVTVTAYRVSDGRVMPGFPLDFANPNDGAPHTLIADIDGTRGLELLVLPEAVGETPLMTVYQIPSRAGKPSEKLLWGRNGGGPGGGRFFAPSTYEGYATDGMGAAAKSGEPYIWPNPVTEGKTARVRAFPGDNRGSWMDVTVYDLAGREQLSARGAVQGLGEIELPLNVSSLPSGVYVARVEVGDDVHTIRFAVVN